MEYHDKLAKIDENKILSNYQDWKDVKNDIQDINNQIKLNESKTKSLLKHKDDLDKFKYDEDCEFCIKNGKEQITEQNEIKLQLSKLDNEYNTINDLLNKKSDILIQLSNAQEKKEELERFRDELSQIQHDAVKVGGKIDSNKAKFEHLKSQINDIESKIKKYYKLEEKIERNKENNKKITDISQQISDINLEKITIDTKYKKVLSMLSVAKNQKENIEQDIQNLVEVEQKILDYDLYLMALSKDGIPYELIAKAIPAIEREVNNVLENMNAGFHLELEMKDKMIDAFICYGETKWNLELSSGMERFVSSLAIRIGLINVSTLPRPNFIIVDEGFGALDSDNIANMEGAFNYLKTQFDFVMIITHLDTIKDYMDSLIPIQVNNEISQVIYC